jgi:sirohydrochlorin ferrochelatase
MTDYKLLLSDNGSKAPAATLMLRQLAARLGQRVGQPVDPVSMQHSDAIDPVELDGMPAEVLPAYLRRELDAGVRRFILLPLFFGVSRALTSYVPEHKAQLEQEFGVFDLELAPVLHPRPDPEFSIAQIVLRQIERARQTVLSNSGQSAQRAVLVDHGTPVERVNKVRREVADWLQPRLDLPLDQACMERREGAEYDFNGELLEDWLRRQAADGVRRVVVSMLFLLPGRHAGPGGDVVEICQSVVDDYPDLQFEITPLVAENEGIVDVLEQRLRQVL